MFLGNTNVDAETGIHYGMISNHSLADWVLDEVYQNGEDLRYNEIRDDLRSAIKSAVSDWYDKDIDFAIEDLIDACLENYESDGYDPRYYETDDGIVVQTSELGLWVFKSPISRMAPVCSPCVPNAGDLDAEDGRHWVQAYSLPSDWLREGLREREQRLIKESHLIRQEMAGSEYTILDHRIETLKEGD